MTKKSLTIGIQGGRGSFNQAALEHILVSEDCPKEIEGKEIKTEFLYQTPKVLSALNSGEIDWGLFAIWNSTTRVVVQESAEAMLNYRFLMSEKASMVFDEIGFPKDAFPSGLGGDDLLKVEVVFSIPIQHYLMRLSHVPAEDIETIMAHPQVFGQCKNNLDKLLPDLKRVSGEGDLINTSSVAKALVEGELDSNTYVLGPKVLAEVYHLTIDMEYPFEDDKVGLQDDEGNRTYFALVKRV